MIYPPYENHNIKKKQAGAICSPWVWKISNDEHVKTFLIHQQV